MKTTVIAAIVLICGVLAVVAFLKMPGVAQSSGGKLKVEDTVAGKGEEAVKGSKVDVHYTGWLNENGSKGKKFDSSLDRGQPFSFTLGAGQVIQGWDEGVAGMKVGGKRTLYIPYSMGYGTRGYPPLIPPSADLIFDVELLSVKK